MRVIWWRISRPDDVAGPIELAGDTLNIHLPEDQSPLAVLQNGEHDIDRDWLNRLLRWSENPRG